MAHNLKQYLRFDTINDLYGAARKHIVFHFAELTRTDLRVLDTIRHYSAMNGASDLTYEEIGDNLGYSGATVQSSTGKLVSLQIIEKIHYVHPVTENLVEHLYTLLPFDKQEE